MHPTRSPSIRPTPATRSTPVVAGRLAAALGLVVGAQGCAEDLRRSIKTDDGALDSGGPVVTEPVEGGEDGSPLVYRTQLDATAEAEWVPLDLDAELAGLPGESGGWDLKAQRYLLALNGGESGEGGVQVAIFDDLTLDELDTAALLATPASAWRTDGADADGDGLPEYAMADWYDYDSAAHTLSPKPRAYGLRSSEGALFALAVEDYYDASGTSGHLSLRWGPR